MHIWQYLDSLLSIISIDLSDVKAWCDPTQKFVRIMNRSGNISFDENNRMEMHLFEMIDVFDRKFHQRKKGEKALKWHWAKWHLMEQSRLFGFMGGGGDQSIERKHQDGLKFKRMAANAPTPEAKFRLISDYFIISEQAEYLLYDNG